ncbi:hypothetical protein H4219_001726 [Mycoemilia scoparia]|uniref:UDP-glucose 6-dehydrogenase n=1 Tax=Mycoemilia scoparia TaxID=417184 RepID=A0A9W8DVP5_9FUNG|nr:hypothetical protein H4219_001726 [Mycoemilia scoparia]
MTASSNSNDYDIKCICFIGAGYVGGPTAAVFAKNCPNIKIMVADKSIERIDQWNSDELPIYEPGLEELVKNQRGINLFFTSNIDDAILQSDIVFITVNTPLTKISDSGSYGMDIDVENVIECSKRIARIATSDKIVVEKSTVPCRTAAKIMDCLEKERICDDISFIVLSNPEFLSEGSSIKNLLNPDRVLLGHSQAELGLRAQEALKRLYAKWVPTDRIITTNASNALLAQRISSINSLTPICEKINASIEEVALACGFDKRIGSSYLRPSIGFGGSCLEKDVHSLIWLSDSLGLYEVADYWKQVLKINAYQQRRFFDTVVATMEGSVYKRKIACLGFAFKKDTGDTRQSPAISICTRLIEAGAIVNIYDPKVKRESIQAELETAIPAMIPNVLNAKRLMSKVTISSDLYSAIVDVEAVLVLTDWDEFRNANWKMIYTMMKKPAFVFDGRICLNQDLLHSIGFDVYMLGKPSKGAKMPSEKQKYSSDGIRLISGCVPIDIKTRQVLLITSRKHPDQWVLPKGGWDEGETQEEAAVRETWEEAGIVGESLGYLGVWDHDKITKRGKPKGKLAFYLFKVESLKDSWPEKDSRIRKYFPMDEAIRLAKLNSMKYAIREAFRAIESNIMSESEDDQQPCPRCPPSPDLDADCYESWLQCDKCDTWLHANCVGLGEDEVNEIDIFYCPNCYDKHGPSTTKSSKVRRSSRPHLQVDYSKLDDGEPAIFNQYTLRLEAREFEEAEFPRLKNGHELTLDWILEQREHEPIIIEEPEGLGMEMPPSDITVKDIASKVGENMPVSVMDVLTQNELSDWSMGDWSRYYSKTKNRKRIMNVISLEISDTDFGKTIKRPKIVDQLDAITNYWPSGVLKTEYNPKIQLYCLMSVSECFTDFHVDFSGSWVYYHLLSGEKVFYFIAPTPTNLRKYEKWSKSPDQQSTFFGDEVKHCYKVTLKARNTMIIPAGWIHAVYTPKDAIVFGGNYLALGTFDKHIQVYNLEARTDVPMRYRLPYFVEMCGYLCTQSEEGFEERGKSLTDSELFGLFSLSEFIENIARQASEGNDNQALTKPHIIDSAQKLSTLVTLELNRRQGLPEEKKRPNYEGKIPKMETRRTSIKLAAKKKSKKPTKSIKMRLKALVKAREGRKAPNNAKADLQNHENNDDDDDDDDDDKDTDEKDTVNRVIDSEEYLGTMDNLENIIEKEGSSDDEYSSDGSEAVATSSEEYSDAENYLSDEIDDLGREKRKKSGTSSLLSRRFKKNKPDIKAFINIGMEKSSGSKVTSPKSDKSRSVQQRIMQRLKMKIR